MENLLNRIQHCLKEGRLDEAATLVQNRNTRSAGNPDLHLRWADVLEELGLISEAVEELNLAIRDDPDRVEVYSRLAEIYLDQGRPEKAARIWERLIERQPQNPEYYRHFGQALLEAKDYSRAKEVFQQALNKTGDESFQAHLKSLNFLDDTGDVREAPSSPEVLSPTQNHLIIFSTLFAGREGVYARQWLSPTGESGYTPVEEPFTPKVAENHILGNFTVGVYPVRLDNTVNFIAFDFDLAKFAVRSAITNRKAWEGAMDRVHQATCRLLDLASENSLPMYLEDSGFKGRHAWIFLEEPIPAGVAKKLGDLLIAKLLPFPSEVHTEVFPKQGSVPRGNLGNLIKLPLGIHRRTGKRALFITPENRPYADQLVFLEEVIKSSRRSAYSLIQRLQSGKVISFPKTSQDTVAEPSESVISDADEGVAPVPPIPDSYDLERDLQFQTLILKCSVVKAIVEKINRTYQVTKDESMVLIHTVGHLDRGPEAVNELFQRCANADPSLFLKSRLKGNPMSCPKIRIRIPAVTSSVACNCVFDSSINLYPTPVIHARTSSLEGKTGPLGLTVDSIQFQNLLQEYVRLRKQLREMTLLMEKYESRLKAFFDEAGVEFIQTHLGKLRKIKTEDGTTSFSLEI